VNGTFMGRTDTRGSMGWLRVGWVRTRRLVVATPRALCIHQSRLMGDVMDVMRGGGL
jgi:hypothetical protein